MLEYSSVLKKGATWEIESAFLSEGELVSVRLNSGCKSMLQCKKAVNFSCISLCLVEYILLVDQQYA